MMERVALSAGRCGSECVEYSIVNQKSDLLMKYYENVKNQDQENSIFRHDLKNHLSVIKDSLPECMSVYVNDIMPHIDKDNIRFYSDNKILEALINDKLDQAKRNGIELSVKCDDTNIEILSDYDLVTILSNLIDNSIDAVNTNISEERQIILRIKEVKNNLVIKIKNAGTTSRKRTHKIDKGLIDTLVTC